jgi:hypothetical protein
MGVGSQKRHRNSPGPENNRDGLEKSPCKPVEPEENRENDRKNSKLNHGHQVKWEIPVNMISIGSIIGGGELTGSQIHRLIGRFCRALPSVQDPVPFDINIVFHVPGSIVKPDYSGIRTGRFSAKQRKLMILVSVPDNLMDSPELESYFHKSMIEAVHLAKGFFGKKKIQFNETEYLRIIQEMKGRLEKD